MTKQNLLKLAAHYKKVIAGGTIQVSEGYHGMEREEVVKTIKVTARNQQDAKKNLEDLYKKNPSLRVPEDENVQTSKKSK